MADRTALRELFLKGLVWVAALLISAVFFWWSATGSPKWTLSFPRPIYWRRRQKPTPFPFSIRKNIELPLREHGVRDKQALTETLESSLRSVGLWHEVKDRLQHSALNLSGGQQRLCIARTLALKPEVWLMDEPCSALDPLASGMVEELVVALTARYSIVLVTHNLAQARRIAEEAAFFWFRDGAGVLVEQGPAAKLFQQPKDRLTAAYVFGEKG